VNTIIYDIEIKRAILKKGEKKLEGIEYCEGWRDFTNMGIACIGAYDYVSKRYRVFMDDNYDEFRALVETSDLIVSFNGLEFDNVCCRANGIHVPDSKSYDILAEMWRAAGLGPTFQYQTHGGFGLDAVCKANFGISKTGNGALAPVDYQQGNFGKLIDYCLNDVMLTKTLFDELQRAKGKIRHPKWPDKALVLRSPKEAVNVNPR
jgi:hypothetical protein